MITFLFWNTNKKPLLGAITSLVDIHNVDILILAESELNDNQLLKSLNSQGGACFSIAQPGLPARIKIYSRLSRRFVKPVRDSRYIVIRRIMPPVALDLILVAVHLPSKLYQREQDQILNCPHLAWIVEKAEREIGHTRTLIIGDLNMNPFEGGIVGAEGFHAVSDRRIAEKGSRRIAEKHYQFFYNPMWNFFGDAPPRPPGTYFYDTGTQANMYWNIFDHVLIRPALLDTFADEHLRVLTEVGSSSLLSKSGQPDKKSWSDHLPILLSLRL